MHVQLARWLDRTHALDTLSLAFGIFTAGWGVDLILAQNRFERTVAFRIAADKLPIAAWGALFLLLGATIVITVVARARWRVVAIFAASALWALLSMATTATVFHKSDIDGQLAVPATAYYSLGMMVFLLIAAAAYSVEQHLHDTTAAMVCPDE